MVVENEDAVYTVDRLIFVCREVGYASWCFGKHRDTAV